MRAGLRHGRFTSGTISRLFTMLAVAGGLVACNEIASDMGLATSQKVMAPTGVPISVESLSGGSEAIRTKFAGALSQEASQRQIELVGPTATPRYRIRGYLDAAPGEDGKVALAFIWDVYDTKLKQAKRVEGEAKIGGSASDPWAAVNEKALQAVAAQSMNEIAGFLVAAGPATGSTQVASAPAKPTRAGAKPVAAGPANPMASGSAQPMASGSAQPMASGSAQPMASGSAQPMASGSAQPMASGSAQPMAYAPIEE